jgi:hypothetical protein
MWKEQKCEAYHMHETAIYGLKTVNQMATSAISLLIFVSAFILFSLTFFYGLDMQQF